MHEGIDEIIAKVPHLKLKNHNHALMALLLKLIFYKLSVAIM
jgi:hypothetical protein